MGILYSHIVFQPPSPPSYTDDAGTMTFRKVRNDSENHHGSDNDSDDQSCTDAGDAGSSADPQYVQHPVFYLTTSKGQTLPAAYFHHHDSHFTILFSHGNGEDLGVTASYALELSKSLKTSVLCYDYSGYGLSTGKPSENNCYADINAAYTYLVSDLRVSPDRIVLFGRSLGSGPTVELASRLGRNLAGVVLIAALTSCVRVVLNAPHTMGFDMFPNIDKIDRVFVPVFCVHGMMDDVVPFSHGLHLSRRARYPLEPLWVRGAGHNDLESSRFQYEVFSRYRAVLEELKTWKAPVTDSLTTDMHPSRRRDSFGALVKAAGCFGASRNTKDHAVSDPSENGCSRAPRRRLSKHPASLSGSDLLAPNFAVNAKHNEQLRAMWCKEDDQNNLVQRVSEGDGNRDRLSRFVGRKRSAESARHATIVSS